MLCKHEYDAIIRTRRKTDKQLLTDKRQTNNVYRKHEEQTPTHSSRPNPKQIHNAVLMKYGIRHYNARNKNLLRSIFCTQGSGHDQKENLMIDLY